MKELTREEIILRSERVLNTIQNDAGWKDIRSVIDEMRREAFDEWAALPLKSSSEEITAIRAKELVLKELLERVDAMVRYGNEAKERDEEAGVGEERTRRFLGEFSLADEMRRLLRPLTPPIFATTPTGAANEKARESGEPGRNDD